MNKRGDFLKIKKKMEPLAQGGDYDNTSDFDKFVYALLRW